MVLIIALLTSRRASRTETVTSFRRRESLVPEDLLRWGCSQGLGVLSSCVPGPIDGPGPGTTTSQTAAPVPECHGTLHNTPLLSKCWQSVDLQTFTDLFWYPRRQNNAGRSGAIAFKGPGGRASPPRQWQDGHCFSHLLILENGTLLMCSSYSLHIDQDKHFERLWEELHSPIQWHSQRGIFSGAWSAV